MRKFCNICEAKIIDGACKCKPRLSFAQMFGKLESLPNMSAEKTKTATELCEATTNAITAMHAAYRLLDSVAYVAREGDSAPILADLSAACARLGRPIISGG